MEQKSPDIAFSFLEAGSKRTIHKGLCGTRIVRGDTNWTNGNRAVSTELASLLLIGRAHVGILEMNLVCDRRLIRRAVRVGEAGLKTRSLAKNDCGHGCLIRWGFLTVGCLSWCSLRSMDEAFLGPKYGLCESRRQARKRSFIPFCLIVSLS